MHIIIDIRDAHPLTSLTERYGENWGALWHKYHPHDTLSYLIFDTQIPKSERYIQVPKGSKGWWTRKKLVAHKGNEVYRCVNFSAYEPYSKSIPTLTHIFHNRSWLYPNEAESTFIARKSLEYKMYRSIKASHKIIVPSMSIGLECVELWGVGEHNIEIIPYIPFEIGDADPLTPVQFQLNRPFFLYDGGFGSEGNIIHMLKGFEVYRHLCSGTFDLIMHGLPGHELSHLTQMIRAFDLTEHVKLIGVLDRPQYEWIYTNAKAWIMVGSYYSGGPRIELAHSHKLPMILAHLPGLKNYTGIRIHPNHVSEELGPILLNIENNIGINIGHHEYREHDIISAYEMHLSENKHGK